MALGQSGSGRTQVVPDCHKILDKMKYEIAGELGLLDKLNEVGWGGLTAKETGKIGGLITVRKKQRNKENEKGKKDNS